MGKKATVGQVKRALRRAGFRECSMRRGAVAASGFRVVEWRYPHPSLSVHYSYRPGENPSVDALIIRMGRYQEAIHKGTTGCYAGVHVGFPCSVGGVHICIDLR